MARQYTTDKGTTVLNGMILSQYRDSPILKQYMLAYIEEMDELFEAVERVYFGRLFEDAEGEQLDIIGRIVAQGRNVSIGKVQFGFDTVLNGGSFGDTDNPSTGGVFRSQEDGGFTLSPLDDTTYKKLLMARFMLMNEKTPSINVTSNVIFTLLGRVPRLFSIVEVARNQVTISYSTSDVTSDEVTLIQYASRWFMQGGVELTLLPQ